MMDMSAVYPDSPLEQDDVPFPCKGCGEILEEGKAFELAGNRWHIDCFRCNTCSTLLDSDANLLLLGDGSLICNNCTYSCSACGHKIEDLAILTGDQAFCATCFRCRNCKKKIENLKYARTSQGIFCMECHESLMQRRRKKSSKGDRQRHRHHHQATNNNSMLLDKSLPSLPPSAIRFTPDSESIASDGYSDTPTELPQISHKKPGNSKPSSHSGTPTEQPRASQKRPPNSRSDSSRSSKREQSPVPPDDDHKDNLTLPSSTYKKNRHSGFSQRSDTSGNPEEFFIPMALDPNPVPGPSPLARNTQVFELAGAEMITELPGEEILRPQPVESRSTSRDYFTLKGSTAASHKAPHDHEVKHTSLVSNSPRDSRHSSQPNSPHIAYQELGWDPSHEMVENARKRKDGNKEPKMQSTSIDAIANESSRDISNDGRSRINGEARSGKFMLQEVPKSKKSGASTRSSRSDGLTSTIDTSLPSSANSAPASASAHPGEQEVILPLSESLVSVRPKASIQEPRQVSQDSKTYEHRPTDSNSSKVSQEPPVGSQLHTLPQRSDSLVKSKASKHHVTRREIATGHIASLSTAHEGNGVGQDAPASAPPSATGHLVTGLGIMDINSGTTDTGSPSSGSVTEILHPPKPIRDRDRSGRAGSISNESFTTPRLPQSLQAGNSKTKHESSSTQMSEMSRNGDQPISPKLPRYSAGGVFTMDDDMARILGNDDQQDHASFLRRVSNSVRHARSYSDRGTRASREPKWPKSPLVASPMGPEISSPISSSPEAREELLWFKNELRRERQKSVEKEQKLLELESALEAKSNIRQMNSELQKKRSTMVVLDTQKEIVVRELEVLTEHIAAAKKSGEPLDISKMSNTVLREFAESLQKLKDSFAPPIEDLTQRKNELVDEVSNLTQLRDSRSQESELLHSKNAELAELNNRLVHQIQELHKANAAPSMESMRSSNGLGMYAPQKEKHPSSLDGREPRNPSTAESNLTGSTTVQDPDGDPATYLTAPQVVNMRKAQPKKFWKKGVAKDITKGLKGAFTSNDQHKTQRDGGQYPEAIPYGSVQQIQEYPNGSLPRGQIQDPSRQAFGFFGNQKGKPVQSKSMTNGTIPTVNADGVPALFGSELEHRTEYERVGIPGIVMRCIEEVEHRGMNVEGIYRKSGGNSQIQQIKEGFERSNDYDISDPDLDINAVTSTLKQYLSKLPTPLITYEVYDKLLESAALIQEDPNRCISFMRVALNNLPARHRNCLEVLVFHLARVVERERENLMTSLNVAVVFAPTIMRPESVRREMTDTQAKNQTVQFLIENCQGVFMGSGD